MQREIKKKNIPPVTFVHSLFRSGSTYFYNALKRTENFHSYHEPMHEVIASLHNSWDELACRKDRMISLLRHDFLVGGYFDEFSYLLPSIKKMFDTKFSFDYYFMGYGDKADDLKAYIDLLVDSAPKAPILQCTRTCGRIAWLKQNYKSNHIFLFRNPWDQWFSYKVDAYITTTPRLIYSQGNTPAVLKAIFEASGASPLIGCNTQEKVSYGIAHPLSPIQDYFLFFGLWLYSFICSARDSNVIIDMDLLSSSEAYKSETLGNLSKIGISSIDFSDAKVHRAVFDIRERGSYRRTEDQIIEIYRQHGISIGPAGEYLESARQESFIPTKVLDAVTAVTLEDAYRARQLLIIRDEQIANLSHTVSERDEQIANLSHTVSERDEQVANLSHTVSEREITIQAIHTGVFWKTMVPLQKVFSMPRKNENFYGNQANENLLGEPGPSAFFTICSKNFLAHARALFNSVRPHYPNSRFFVVLCDRVDSFFDPTQEPFEFIFLEELNLTNLAEMASRYNITEFNTAVKPYAFIQLIKGFHFDSVVYLDPDLFFVDKMQELDQLLADGAEAVLTPHILQPAEHDEVHDGKMLLYGIYNLGFLALRNTPAVNVFLQWWARRLERDCVIRLDEGLFVDQKWADLLPAFVPGARVLHHPGYNVAYWNLPQRKITRKGDRWFANDQPLRFVHFSGNQLDNLTTFSRHSQQVTINNIGDLRELLDAYRQEVYKQGHAFYRSLPYAYSWDGEAEINLHTPKELDLSSREARLVTPVEDSADVATRHLYPFAGLRRRYSVLRQAVPTAKRLSGGWKPLFRRAWRAYRQHGWHHVKLKAVELSGFRAPPSMLVVHQADETSEGGRNSMRLLYLDWAIPKPDQDAASVTAKLLLQIFDSIGYNVTFVPCSLKYEECYYEDLVAANIEIIVYPATQSVNEWLKDNAKNFDVCVMARGPVVWPYLETIKACAPNLRLIFNTVDLHYLRELRQAELANDEVARQSALELRDQELELIDKCDLTILLSNDELYTVRELRPEAPLTVLPIVFKDISGADQGYEQRRHILFIGSFPHKPNIDAVIFFAKLVFPIIKRQIPDICFKVIGANPPEAIQRLAEVPGIDILGFVKDLDPVFADIRLTVAPLRYGAGIKGKIGTSLCYGVPCVATPIAVEGMGLTAGKNVLVGETPEQFASAVCDAYLNAEIWKSLSREGHKFALENYSVEVVKDRVYNLLFAVTNGWQPIHNVVEIDRWESFQKHSVKMDNEYERRLLREQALLPTDGSDSFRTPGFCCVCGTHTSFLTSFMFSTGITPDGRPMPNWREHMQCEHCGLVNRIRAAINALHIYAPPKPDSQIYITERVTKTYHWFAARYQRLQGSEYFGSSYHPGASVDGIRHEDLMYLSFPDSSFDRVLSFDVLEHVSDPYRAFRELFRVLNPGGVLIFTVPFSSQSQVDIVRASLSEDCTIVHHLPPEYHGNPLDPEGGALAFRYFGWEMMSRLRDIGFKNVRCLAYWSEQQGYLGREQTLFIATK